MESVAKLKHWQIFLIFILPSYFISYFGLSVIVVFELAVFSLWIYNISINADKNGNTKAGTINKVFFAASCFLIPVSWAAGYFSSQVLSGLFSLLFLLLLVVVIYLATKAFKQAGIKINSVYIAFGLLIPVIGVWYIQPWINQQIYHPEPS